MKKHATFSGVLFALMLFSGIIAEANDIQTERLKLEQRLEKMEEQLRLLTTQQQQWQKVWEEPSVEIPHETSPHHLSASEKAQDVLTEKVTDLEDQVIGIDEEIQSLSESLQERISFNLYATLEFEAFRHSNAIFDARNIELFAEGRLTDRLRGFAEIEFERTAKTSMGPRQGEVEVEQGWMEFMVTEWFKPRAGVILVPFGRFNLDHFDPIRDLTDRPIAMRRVIPITWAEAGAGFNGSAFFGDRFQGTWFNELAVDYSFYLLNGLTNAISDTGTRSARGAFGSDNNNNKAFVGRIQTTLLTNVELGFSGYVGSYDSRGHTISGVDGDWKIAMGPVEFLGEYAWLNLEKGGFQSGSSTQRVPRSLRGGYAQVNYHFWFDGLNETFLGQGFNNPTFTGMLRYGHARIADDNDLGTGANKESRLTIGLNYRPSTSFVFKTEYQFNDTRNEPLERGDDNGFVTSISAAF